jgi:hypothetical protein
MAFVTFNRVQKSLDIQSSFSYQEVGAESLCVMVLCGQGDLAAVPRDGQKPRRRLTWDLQVARNCVMGEFQS